MKTLNQVINTLNSHKLYSSHGSVSIRSEDTSLDEVREESGFDVQPGDIVIYYDYMDDEMDESEIPNFQLWLYDNPDGCWCSINRWMIKNGYRSVDINDGSGGGLYYGINVYRK